jgi:predicted metal-binding membrane protein
MPGEGLFERLLKRDRAVTIAGLAALAALAWIYVLAGAGMDMSAWQMTTLSLFPHRVAGSMAPMPGMEMSGALKLLMWWIMMIAMMTPAAAPAILLYARVHRQADAKAAQGLAPTGAFAAGYLLTWLGFAVVATLLHGALERTEIFSPATLGSQSRILSGALLIGAGLYQFSPVKGACLSHCRSPASFLAQHWRPGFLGALRLGVTHGVYCVGCCWMLMALLFVGGVMNVVWIAALAILVLLEKAAPAGGWVARGAGVVLIVWGAATLLLS